MDKESIRLILANISQLAVVPQLSAQEIETAITKLDKFIVQDKGPGSSIEGPGYPLSALPHYLYESDAVEKRFSLEMMLREIRTGRFYYCGYGNGSDTNDCASGGNVLTFKNYLGKTVIYRLNNGRIEKSSDGGSTYSVITFPEVQISDLKFYVLGSVPAGQGDAVQPRITITIKGEAETAMQKSKSEFNIQTTVSQRIIDS